MILVLGGIGYYYLGGYAEIVDRLHAEAKEIVSHSTESDFIPSQTVSVYDADGNLISQKRGSKEADYVRFEDIPSDYVMATISIEDKKFYSHNGVDFRGILRAVKAMVLNGEPTQGASTITMQLAKLIYMDSGRDWQYKIKQMFIAIELEKIYSKNKIMEFYLNNMYFANGYYGIQSACYGYFNAELSDLDISQIAFLISVPNSPTYYDPLVNFDNTLKRRNTILASLRDDGKLTQEEYEAAVAEEIDLNLPEKKTGLWNNYVDTYVYYCATRALMKANGFEFQSYFDSEESEKEYWEKYDEQFAMYQKQLFTSGYSIYTSIDMKKQKALQNSIDEALAGYTETNDEGVYDMQSSGVCIDNDTGMVAAIVGGRSQDFSAYTYNRAYQSHRQPGSSIKPLLIYTPSFEAGYTKDSVVVDQYWEDGPKNAGEYYWGEVTIQFAVAHSLNTVAWKLYEELTPQVGLEYLKKMNFSAIKEEDYVLATSLGGFTRGVSALEMASGYATIENDGFYREPTCIRQLVDQEENTIYSYSPEEILIYGETSSRMMTEVLKTVFEEGGTGAGLSLDNDMPCAGKTGTTNDKKDGWFVGYTRYYTTAIWVGCDMPKQVEELSGSTYPGHIWQSFMNQIHGGLAPLDFLPYAQLSDEFLETLETETEETESEEELDEGRYEDIPGGEIPDEETPNEENPDEEAPDEEAPDEETPNEENPDEEAPDEETPDEEMPDEEIPDEENR